METLDNTIITTGLYNKEFTETVKSDSMLDTDCGFIGQSHDKKCVYLNLCIDKSMYDWVASQGENYHKTIKQLITHAMGSKP